MSPVRSCRSTSTSSPWHCDRGFIRRTFTHVRSERGLDIIVVKGDARFRDRQESLTYTYIAVGRPPMTHTLFRKPGTAPRTGSLVLSRVVSAAEVVVLRLKIELLAVPTSDWPLLA